MTASTAPAADAPADVTGSNSTDYSSYFYSDSSSYHITNDGSDSAQIVKLAIGASYTVTFDANGHGTAPSAKTNVMRGSTIPSPTALTESGCTFGGWYTDSSCMTDDYDGAGFGSQSALGVFRISVPREIVFL